MIELTDEMNDAFGKAAGYVGTASLAGEPDVAPKGSLMVWDSEHLAFWERAHGQTQANLEANPHVCVYFLYPAERLMWKFFGTAEVITSGEVRDGIMARTIQGELDRDPDRTGAAVLIRVDRVISRGQVLMAR